MTTEESGGCGCLLIIVLIGLFLCADKLIDKIPEFVQVIIIHKQETP